MKWQWLIWAVASLLASFVLGFAMFFPDWLEDAPIDRTIFLPGATTDGHYQIEVACNACHTANFADRAGMQEACTDCHGAELERVDDSHPRSKFTDPRNADRIEDLDARWCISCHQEHRPEITSTMGLSLPGDYCFECHRDVGEERPTHRDLAFDSCASSGCHNFHDNKALYEDFLVEHRADPDFLEVMRVRPLDPLPAKGPALAASAHDAPHDLPDLNRWVTEWAGTSHADSGVNCRDCHASDQRAWSDRPSQSVCEECHASEWEEFAASRHGMRLAQGLSPMTPGDARIPMKEDAFDHALSCNQCHGAHAYDTRAAAVDSCLSCHADDHTLAFEASPHADSWKRENEPGGLAGSGVSCATCHMPRVAERFDPKSTRVAHNPNDFLRPNEKMIRPACLSCHGLAFSIDSLADPALVTANFRGRPAQKNESIHYAVRLRWELEGRAPPWSDANEENEE